MLQCLQWISSAVLFTFALTAPSSVSAGWAGNIVIEEPAGQAEAAGLADNLDDTITITDSEFLFLTGNGAINITVTSPKTAALAQKYSATGKLAVTFNNPGLSGSNFEFYEALPAGDCCNIPLLSLISAPPGATVLIEATGTFDYVFDFFGPQNGKFTFQLTAN